MTKDETRMTKQFPMTNDEAVATQWMSGARLVFSSFGLRR
jgi:hypothetical protein